MERELNRVTITTKMYSDLLTRASILDEILLLIGKSGKTDKLESVEHLIIERNVPLFSERV